MIIRERQISEFIAPFCPLHGVPSPCFACIIPEVVTQIRQENDGEFVMFQEVDMNSN